jgi:hypothetical protein
MQPSVAQGTIVLVSLALTLAACGGSSSTDPNQNPTTGGSAGGSALPTGSGGGANASGGNSPGGSPGSSLYPGGFALPIDPDDPLLADAGASLPPASDAGPAVTPEPPLAEVIDGCAALCAKQATASCPAQQSLTECRVGCSLLLANPQCTAATRALFICSETATPACNADGTPTLQGCEGQLLTAAGCFLLNANDPAMKDPCTTYCAKVAALGCPGDSPENQCVSSCGIMGNLFRGCGPGWSAYVDCANGATLSCGSDGKASAPSCVSQAVSFLGCALMLYGSVAAPQAGGA